MFWLSYIYLSLFLLSIFLFSIFYFLFQCFVMIYTFFILQHAELLSSIDVDEVRHHLKYRSNSKFYVLKSFTVVISIYPFVNDFSLWPLHWLWEKRKQLFLYWNLTFNFSSISFTSCHSLSFTCCHIFVPLDYHHISFNYGHFWGYFSPIYARI